MITNIRLKLLLGTMIAVISGADSTLAQSPPSPIFSYGSVPTAGQWNSFFQAKQDVLGFTPMGLNGGVLTGPLTTTPSTTALAGFSVPPGVAPASPVNGNIWMTNTGLFAQIGGVTVGPLSLPSVSVPLLSSTMGGVTTLSIANGTSVLNPGTGTLEAVLPVQAASGSSRSFATADLFKKTRRSNSGSPMSDVLPASSATGMVNGARVDIANVDASATDTLTAGAGTSIAAGCATVTAGRDVMLVYDLPNTTWRGDGNSCGALLGSDNLSDLASAATARSNLGLTGVASATLGTGLVLSTGVLSVASPLPSGLSIPSPILITPNLGTPSALTLTNATGMPTAGLTGTLQAGQFPALTGDVATTAGALATTLATVNSAVGACGSAGNTPIITLNGKGLATACTTTAVTAAAAGSTGQVQFNASSSLTASADLFWDNTNHVLSVNNSSPAGGSNLEIDTASGQAGPGTISVSGTTTTGTSTKFLESFQNGDVITSGANTATVTAVASDTSMTTTAWSPGNPSGGSSYTLAGGQRLLAQQSGRLVVGGGSNVNGGPALILASRAFANNGGVQAITGVSSTPSLTNTSATFTGSLYGFLSNPTVAASNTQNWTGNLVGVSGVVSVTSGASGAIANEIGIYAQTTSNLSSTATVTSAYGVDVGSIANSGTMTGAAGIAVANITAATNNTQLLLGTVTIPTGNFSIYDSNTSSSYFAGSVGIGTTSPTGSLNIASSGSSIINVGNVVTGHTYGTVQTSADTGGYFSIQSVGNLGTSFGSLVLEGVGGNVGIGTTSPGSLLTVNGTAQETEIFDTGPMSFPGWFDITSPQHGCAAAVASLGTDQSAAIQCHINWEYAHDGIGGVVYVPNGNYTIISGITLFGGVRLVGASEASSYLNASATDVNVVTLDATCLYCGLENLVISGLQSSAAANNTVKANLGSISTIRDVEMTGGNFGLEMHGSDSFIENSYISGWGTNGGGVFSDSANWYIRDKIDSVRATKYGFFQTTTNAGGDAENFMVGCDLTGGPYTYSLFISDTTGVSMMKIVGSVFANPISIGQGKWTEIEASELGSTSFAISSAGSGPVSLVGNLALAGITITGTGVANKLCSASSNSGFSNC